MRRIDHDGHVVRQGLPPFRVLAVPDTAYLSPSPSVVAPPPPRAPEPYKVAPSSTSFGRAHRRSSFVILAESRPATPEAESPSPPLPTGRISPFRGRGFKGPPPRSKSRPQSPEISEDGRRRGRLERRISVSQQNSPRRSLIPQPTYRQRSTSLTKANDHPSSPKISRRVDSKTRLNVSDSRNRLNAANSKTRLNKFESKSRTNLSEPRTRFISNSTSNLYNPTTRRQTTKGSTRLSPIQGTPTKLEKTNSVKTDRAKDSSKVSPRKTPRTSMQKNTVTTRRDNQDKSSSKERITSPSKIPLKTNGSFTSSTNTGRFISIPEQNSEKSKKVDKASKENMNSKQNDESTHNDRSFEPNLKEIDRNSSGKVDDVDILNLMMQSSHVTGTSSERLVNTTTATAVQPLHIDANTLLVDRDDKLVTSQQKDRVDSSKSFKNGSPVIASIQNGLTSEKLTALVENHPSPAKTNQARNDKKDSLKSTENTGGHSKSGSISQSTKNVARTKGEDLNNECSTNQPSVNQLSANQRPSKSIQNVNSTKLNDEKLLENPEMSTMPPTEVKSGSAGTKMAVSHEVTANDKISMIMEKDPKINKATISKEMEMETVTTETITNNRMNNATTVNNTMKTNNVNSTINAMNTSVNSDTVRTRNENHGSDVSLKSSTGASSDSIESIRSTDTGVSVNTVKGLSSPREKTGVHVVKRPQEIETLSGNIVHFEQNGEPAVLASNNEKQGSNENLLARWRRNLHQYCKCCSGMRCLACRRDPKGLLWTKNHERRMTVINDTPQPVATIAADAPPPAQKALSCWKRLKTRCRCARLREIKCCTKKSRVAPAESTVCCPPERRFGAICRRMFSCCSCSCKRANTQQRTTRNIRAKHSLTSVAPPPLSEELKPKIPDVLVEHNSVMRGAIPCLPVPLAWFCLIWNVLLPGSGTVWSGLFNLCTGQPRFSAIAGLKSRLGALIVNLVVGVGQLFTVLFCLVGWGWSIWWGVTMVRLARAIGLLIYDVIRKAHQIAGKYKRFRDSEAASNDPEARGSEPAALPPGVPSQALRGVERAR